MLCLTISTLHVQKFIFATFRTVAIDTANQANEIDCSVPISPTSFRYFFLHSQDARTLDSNFYEARTRIYAIHTRVACSQTPILKIVFWHKHCHYHGRCSRSYILIGKDCEHPFPFEDLQTFVPRNYHFHRGIQCI